MNETQFHANLDCLMDSIEDILDKAETDLDYMNNSGLLNITCESGVQLVVSRQAPLLQLWLASPAGGLRFNFDREHWRQEGEKGNTFGVVFANLLQEFTGENLDCSDLDNCNYP